MTGDVQVAVVGAGQAGLSMSWLLGERGIEHVVLERETPCHDWVSRRWESFCLVTPNHQCRLPGWSYDGPDPEGFMLRDEVVRWLAAYRESFDPPVRTGVEVTRLDAGTRLAGGFRLETGDGLLEADQVVIATGGYHVPRFPAMPLSVAQLHSAAYRSAVDLPDGDVLVVGSGQSGVQIAEDLHLAGRRVHLAVGTAPRAARRYRGHDTITWLERMGHYARSAAELGNERGHDRANHYMTGRRPSHDVDLRAFGAEGMRLHGRLLGVAEGTLRFGDDLGANLDRADAVAAAIKASIDGFIADHGLDAPTEPPYVPGWLPPGGGSSLAESSLGAVIWATGFRRDDGWNRLPAFDGGGFPVHDRGVSPVPGLYWLGLPWQHTWGSGRFAGVADDAAYLAAVIGARTPVRA